MSACFQVHILNFNKKKKNKKKERNTKKSIILKYNACSYLCHTIIEFKLHFTLLQYYTFSYITTIFKFLLWGHIVKDIILST